MVDLQSEDSLDMTNVQPGSLVQFHGLQSASAQKSNGRFAVVSKPLKKASADGRLPVLYSHESSGGLKVLHVKPENLNFFKTLELKVRQINVQGGGILHLDGSNVLLSFEWLERVSEEPPWYFVPDPPDAKWREPFAENEVEALQAVYMRKLEQCFAQNDSKGLATICDDMVSSIVNFTQFGSQ
jgi:hypothetical protein